MDLTEGSETSAIINQTPGNYPKESLLQLRSASSLSGQGSRVPKSPIAKNTGECYGHNARKIHPQLCKFT